MALGGGTFLTQNKILPGAYINFVSAARATATLSDRGYAAMPVEMDWGIDGDVFRVDAVDFQKNSLKIFGYDYTSESLKGIRDLFKYAKTAYLYKLNQGSAKASNQYATALYTGGRGNSIKIAIEPNELYTATNEIYDITTYFDNTSVDIQTVTEASKLKDNGYVTFKPDAALTFTAATPLSGGEIGTVSNVNYQAFLDKIESYSFNTLGCLSDDDIIKGLFAAFTKRMRDDTGVKFQCVLHRYDKADYEGVISVENNETPELVYWVTGAEAGCNVNATVTNMVYNGEYTVITDYTQPILENGLKSGKLLFHKVSDNIRVLGDINTFVSVTDTKSKDFASNQTMRVLDQIGNDIAALFNEKYLGKVPNDNAGRISFWNDIVKHHQELEKLRAIENFVPELLAVLQGDTKKSVVVNDSVTPTNSMEQLYMSVVVQ